jgi:hypothetical protein
MLFDGQGNLGFGNDTEVSRNGGGTPPPSFSKTTVAESRHKRPNWRTGAPAGNTNAVKTGCHTKQMKALRAEVRLLLARTKALTKLAWSVAVERDVAAKDERLAAHTRDFVQEVVRLCPSGGYRNSEKREYDCSTHPSTTTSCGYPPEKIVGSPLQGTLA